MKFLIVATQYCYLSFLLGALFNICILSPGFAQLSFGKEFDALTDQASALYESGDFLTSAVLYDSAFVTKNQVYPLSSFHINATKAWAQAGHLDRAFFHLSLAVQKCWVTKEDLLNSAVLGSLHDDPRWEEILQAVESKAQKYLRVVQELETIRNQDQFLRQLEKCARETSSMGSGEMALFYQTMNEYDSINLLAVQRIVEEYGWLSAGKIGERASQTLWAVIQHSSDVVVQQFYLPIIKESVMKGETPARQYAFLVDRIAVNSEQPQVYGTQICTDKESGEAAVCPIIDPGKVDQRRAEIGFEPLAEYLQFFGIDYREE